MMKRYLRFYLWFKTEKLRESEPAYEGLCSRQPQTPCETGLMGVCAAGRQTVPVKKRVVKLYHPSRGTCNRLDDDRDEQIDEAGVPTLL